MKPPLSGLHHKPDQVDWIHLTVGAYGTKEEAFLRKQACEEAKKCVSNHSQSRELELKNMIRIH